MKRTPMRRTAFKRKHEPTVPRAERPMALHKPLAKAPNYAGSTTGQPIAKDNPVRSEAYRRRVAALACICCNKPGPSQCAHANTGKGMALKASDLDTFPLCPGCHRDFDQGAKFTKDERRELEKLWITKTRAALETQ